MKWSKEFKPNNKIRYNHVKCETPIGEFVITWKGWKDSPSYDVELNDEWIGSESDLQNAKKISNNYIIDLTNQLIDYGTQSN